MKSLGMTRKVDELGRIVFPIEMRRRLDIKEGDMMEMFTEGDNIILKKYQPSCVFCGSYEKLTVLHEKNICKTCRGKIASI